MAKSEIRIDKWLWAVRIFKTRTVATDACKKGRVTIGDEHSGIITAKPSRMIKVGDIVNVKKPPVTYSFRVKALTENRLGAKLVPDYMENITSPDQLYLLDMVKIGGFVDRRKGLGRPTKREGRELSKFTSDIYDPDSDYDFDFDEDFFDDDENMQDINTKGPGR